MTQDELDALMSADISDLDDMAGDSVSSDETLEKMDDEYGKVDPLNSYPPPPPTEDHKVVYQLDDVTRESEVKASEIFDRLESVSNELMNIDDTAPTIEGTLKSNIDLFQKLSEKFPDIELFSTLLESNKEAKESIGNITSYSESCSDEVMMAMDTMQYQDIHRQKIERVINVMRALSNYMNGLLEGRIDDSERVSSAVHIAGDTTTEDVVNNDDIEALISAFSK
jgi:chemotaxis regulatin CheY-phosphate phosphatase CheZ